MIDKHVRPGSLAQLVPGVSEENLIGPARPAFTEFDTDDYWLMGINMSLRAEY